MRVHWSRVPRWPRLPVWALAAIATWGGLVLAAGWIEARTGRIPETCVFHALTGRPCPTCGSTRALQALVGGRPLEALALNPLVVVAGGLACVLLLVRIAIARGPVLALNPWERRISLGLGALAVGLNWAWLLAQHR
jgi:hypothetical protein